MPVLRNGFAIGIEDCDLTGPPGIMDIRNDDSGRPVPRRLQYPQRQRSERRRTPCELRQFSPGSPTPFLFASIGVADQRRRVRLWACGGEIREKNAGMALALQVPEPETCPYTLLVVPVGRESLRKGLSPEFLPFR